MTAESTVDDQVELEVLACLAGGLSDVEIATTSAMSIAEVKHVLRRVYGRLGVRGRWEAALRARSALADACASAGVRAEDGVERLDGVGPSGDRVLDGMWPAS